ncbi:unnamed protein product [Schistosoma mattheei]|uniref:Uncharacterized protein n=1 Tax=Schistosoma mattheei TaxID=31246 RepID=A0AA85C2R5_9TREM|nr:unnamed protein product [Schistosoma mattheei]
MTERNIRSECIRITINAPETCYSKPLTIDRGYRTDHKHIVCTYRQVHISQLSMTSLTDLSLGFGHYQLPFNKLPLQQALRVEVGDSWAHEIHDENSLFCQKIYHLYPVPCILFIHLNT